MNFTHRKKTESPTGVKLEMTPMIDVVFQLLIFFLFTMNASDLLAKLEVFRPATPQNSEEKPIPLNRIEVYDDLFVLNGKRVTEAGLRAHMKQTAGYSRTQTVIIITPEESAHGRMVRALDICYEAGLTNLALMSR